MSCCHRLLCALTATSAAVADKIHNAEFQVREPHIRVEDIIDVIEGKNSA